MICRTTSLAVGFVLGNTNDGEFMICVIQDWWTFIRQKFITQICDYKVILDLCTGYKYLGMTSKRGTYEEGTNSKLTSIEKR